MFQIRPYKKTRLKKQLLAFSAGLILAFSLATLPASFNGQKAYAHGPGPGTCGNEYDYTLESFTINNGVHTFDILANQDNVFVFNGNNDEGYDVTFTIHTASQSVEGNTQNGSIWYHRDAFGFGQGVCVDDIMPDQDKTIVVENVVPAQQPGNNGANGDLWHTSWDFRYFEKTIDFYINWYDGPRFPTTDTGSAAVTIVAIDYNSTDFDNNRINGMYINLTQNGQVVDEGFTPVTFTLQTGEEYQIGAANYGSYEFSFWGQTTADPIFPIKVAETSNVLFYAYYITKTDSETNTSAGTSELTVNTKDGTSGSIIDGYWTVLSKDGSTVAKGFSPAIFTLDDDENYVVSVADYGQYVFDHWQDSDSTARERSISISSDTSITAVYRNFNSPPIEQPPDDEESPPEEEPPMPSEDSSITVRSIDRNSGNEITGYYTALFDNSGNVIETAFTPAAFDVTGGQEYTVEVQDYGSYYFNYWQDNSDTDRDRRFTATDSAQTLIAVYSTSPNAEAPDQDDNSNEEDEQPPLQTTGTIEVTTTDASGNQIYGYYTTLSLNGNVVQAGFSPAEFTVDSGQTYQAAVADYGQYAFDHWSDGSTGRFHDAQAGDSLTALYRP